ncbi:MAG: hypothetical protein ACLQHK_00900 [Gallionellaceae bacterium]
MHRVSSKIGGPPQRRFERDVWVVFALDLLMETATHNARNPLPAMPQGVPTGTILLAEHRSVRDPARKRLQPVRSRTSHILAIENIVAR